MERWGTRTLASKSLFLKHQEGSTQHETLLVVSPGSLHMNTSIENIVCVFLNYSRYGRQKVSIPECNLTGRRVMVESSSSLPVRSYSGIGGVIKIANM